MNEGILKFCSYFILKCKNCGEMFTILKSCQDGSNLMTAEKKVVYCPLCGKKSKPELWIGMKEILQAEIKKIRKR